MSGYWMRDGQRFDTAQEIIDDFWDNQIEYVERDFEQWMNDTYDAYGVLDMIEELGWTVDDFMYEMNESYMRNEFPEICEGEDVETEVDDYVWHEDEPFEDQAYESQRDWELDNGE